MTTRAVAAIEDWESEPFSGGYAGLHDLVDAEFSGVVQSGMAKLCLTHGAAVGILDGDIEDFEDGSGTIYEAPSPALPILALMQERSDEVRAKYYTEDTPISEVDRTLSDGKFSGYIELSENVLSGDYYVVYHAGRSMSVAWVGNNGQLLTDDEAFDRADDEVGIYEVRPLDIEPIDIPEPESPSSGAAGASPGVSGSGDPDGSDDDGTSEEREDAETEDADSGEGDAATDDQTSTETTEAAAGAGASAADEVTDTTEADDDRATSDGTSSRATATDDEGEIAGATAETRDSSEATGDTAASTSSSDGGTASSSDRGESTRDPETEPESPRSAGRSPGRGDESAADETGDARASRTEPEPAERSSSESSQSAGTERTTEPTAETGSAARNDAQTRDAGTDRQSRRETTRQSDDERGSRTGGASADRSSGGSGTGRTDQGGTGSEDVSPAGTLETRSIPSLDPSRTTTARTETGSNGGSVAGGGAASRGSPAPDSTSSGRQESTVETPSETGQSRESGESPATDRSGAPSESQPANNAGAGDPARDSGSRTETQPADDGRSQSSGRAGNGGGADRQPASTGPDPRVADLETELEETGAELERVESELADAEREQDALRRERDDLQAERDSLATEVDQLKTERDELRAELDEKESELDRLRSQLEQLEAEFGAATDADRRMSREEALQQTNLFVRYESKGQATLESAHGGNATREEVNENLGLEYHTQFEAPNVSVAGTTFDEFLEGAIQYRFVAWVINHLLYEIRDTGKVAALEELYDAIPRIDRAELNGTVSVEYMDDGQQRRSQESFDVVLRDRMGNALIVANLNDSRQAATESMMNTLVTAASHVGESEDSLAGAFLVTSSFFEPEALETAAEATSGGLLSRDKRESFVKLSRKRGYHLCLAEARDGQFHLAVPEL